MNSKIITYLQYFLNEILFKCISNFLLTQDFSISMKSQVLSWMTKLDENHTRAVSQNIALYSSIRDKVYDRFTQEKEKQIK